MIAYILVITCTLQFTPANLFEFNMNVEQLQKFAASAQNYCAKTIDITPVNIASGTDNEKFQSCYLKEWHRLQNIVDENCPELQGNSLHEKRSYYLQCFDDGINAMVQNYEKILP
ncbi:hypothetical protein PPYR_09199 [Photinus pyralis]|uniref:Protein TsetseEP domain-containing protein n=1 Tax=Photinus pyralis TaxID=7054 RepID=A0A1Y1LKA9_PHOPY|nr:hypothetical protein PPYR_09199 [Photinus pyralis]